MTDVGTTPRRSMTATRRLRIFEEHKGICVTCKQPIDGVRQKWFIEHDRALGLGGKDSDENCGPAHYECKPVKDKADIEAIAQAKRRKQAHLGIRVAKSRSFPKPIKTVSPRTARIRDNPKQTLPPRNLFEATP